jgi:membrane fusion protein (multidrug efflux system)
MNIAVDEKIAVQDEQEKVVEQLMHARKQRRKRNLILLGGVVLSTAAVAFGVYWMTVGRYLEQTDDAYVRADWIPISPKVSGYVAQVLVEDDQPVKAGDVRCASRTAITRRGWRRRVRNWRKPRPRSRPNRPTCK